MQMISWPAIWSESTSEPPVETFETIRPVRAWIRKTLRQWADDPLPPLRGVISGWVVLVGYFWTCGDAFSYAAAKWLFGWTPAQGYGTGNFAPYSWFYAMWLGLPFAWSNGFVLTPALVIVGSWLGCREGALGTSSFARNKED
jgi:hypothetical protein